MVEAPAVAASAAARRAKKDLDKCTMDCAGLEVDVELAEKRLAQAREDAEAADAYMEAEGASIAAADAMAAALREAARTGRAPRPACVGHRCSARSGGSHRRGRRQRGGAAR